MTQISIKNLSKTIGNHRVVSVPEIHLHGGTHYIIQGKNGSGKTSFLRLLAGIYEPDQNSVSVPTRSLQCSYFEDGFGLYNDLSVKEHFNFYRKILSEDRKDHIIEEFQLSEIFSKKLGTLSRGWQSRVGIALTFIRDADLILLDEPLNGLDTAGIELLLKKLKEFRENNSATIIVIASHQAQYFPRDSFTFLAAEDGVIQTGSTS